MDYQPVWVPPFDSVDRFSCGCRDAMVSGQNRCAACLLLPLPELLVFLVLELLPCRLFPEPGWSVDEGFEASNIGCRMRRRALMNQLFTCSNVRFVCAAIWRFSSSVGYGCCKTRCLLLKYLDTARPHVTTPSKLHCNLNQCLGHHYSCRNLVQDCKLCDSPPGAGTARIAWHW